MGSSWKVVVFALVCKASLAVRKTAEVSANSNIIQSEEDAVLASMKNGTQLNEKMREVPDEERRQNIMRDGMTSIGHKFFVEMKPEKNKAALREVAAKYTCLLPVIHFTIDGHERVGWDNIFTEINPYAKQGVESTFDEEQIVKFFRARGDKLLSILLSKAVAVAKKQFASMSRNGKVISKTWFKKYLEQSRMWKNFLRINQEGWEQLWNNMGSGTGARGSFGEDDFIRLYQLYTAIHYSSHQYQCLHEEGGDWMKNHA